MNNLNRILQLLFLITFLYTGCSNNVDDKSGNTISNNQNSNSNMSFIKKLDGDMSIYIDKRFKFSVEYPNKWKAKIEPFWEATPKRNASPDGGINIYLDDKEEKNLYLWPVWSCKYG